MRRRSPLKLYGPFLALALLQAMFIAVAPSRGPEQNSTVAAFGADDPAGGPVAQGPDGLTDASVGATPSSAGSDAGGNTGGGAAGGTAADPGAPGTADPGGEGGDGGAGAAGDTSHCTADGRQHGVLYHAPPCVPKWPEGADNGGATYRGVTADTVKIIEFATAANEQVNAILAAEGLAASEEERDELNWAAVEFLSKHFEFYGREIDYERIVGQNCPTTPPQPDTCKQDAREVIKKDPFIVLFPTPLYPGVFDLFAQEGIITIGGWHFENSYFTQRRPYRYDLNMDGSRSADVLAEYYCKQLAGENATHSGQVIHPDIGLRDQVPRHLGIVVPELEANVLTAQRVRDQVAACGDESVEIFTYESDINRAEEQTRATVAGLIEDDVTTVLCMCDPIAPVFLTAGMTANNYFPEHLLSGMGFMDFDKVGRLYDAQQWAHAFGPSHIQDPLPHEETDASLVWKDSGADEEFGKELPCQSCNLYWAYWNIAGTMIQGAGPNLNPLTVEQALLNSQPRGGWAQTGGNRHLVLAEYGPDDYTTLSDVRQVYWDASAPSRIDGRPGAYVSLDQGRRYRLGELPTALSVPVKPQ